MGLSDFHKYSDENSRAEEYVEEVIQNYGLQEIEAPSVEFTDSLKSTAGKYHFSNNNITLSIHYLREKGWVSMKVTIRHELAHACAYQIDGHTCHGDVFSKWQSILDTTRYCENITSTDRWKYVCPTCGEEWRRKRQTNLDSKYCSHCAEDIGYNSDTQLNEVKIE